MLASELIASLADTQARGEKLAVEELIGFVVIVQLEQERQIAELQKNLELLTGTVSDHTTFHPESGTYHGMDE